MNQQHHYGRFARTLNAPAGSFLTRGELLDFAPSIFADRPANVVSPRYGHLNTGEVLAALAREGYYPTSAAKVRVRDENRVPHARHMVRVRSLDPRWADVDGYHEIIIVNSSDGSSSIKLLSGYFRQVCSNGMVSGAFEGGSIRHTLSAAQRVDTALEAIFQRVREQVQVIGQMRERIVDSNEAEWFAHEAARIRWGYLPRPPINPCDLLAAHRYEDAGMSLWRVLNRVQENLLSRSIPTSPEYREAHKRAPRTTRPVKGLQANLAVNTAIWRAAASLLDKAPPTAQEENAPALAVAA